MVRNPQAGRRSQVLLAHAIAVGIGWFAFGLPVAILVASNTGVSGWLGELASSAPLALATGTAAVVAPFAFPYLWPVHMGIGAWEARLAFALRDGSKGAGRTAARLLVVQATAYALLALALLTWFRGGTAWTVPALVAVLHAAFARWVAR